MTKRTQIAVWVVTGASLCLFLGLWWGIPTYKRSKADAMVNELCAKDGGIKVFESVPLPAERFDKYGVVRVPFGRKAGEEFYLETEVVWLIPYSGEGRISVSRHSLKLRRASDGKLLGESVSYLRRGGDPVYPAHPSSYRCPHDVGVERKVFLKK